MKHLKIGKNLLGVSLLAVTSSAFAEVGVDVELGYDATTVAPNYGDCFSECYGDGEPSGVTFAASWHIGAIAEEVNGLYIGVDIANLEDEEDHYDNTSTTDIPDKVTVEQERVAFELGYKYELNEKAKLVAALVMADHEWSYTYADTDATPGIDRYRAKDDGVSVVLGAEKIVAEDLVLSGALSAGFETGVKVSMSTMLTESFGLKIDYTAFSYELGDFDRIDEDGNISDPNTENGDGDYEMDLTSMRVSATYSF